MWLGRAEVSKDTAAPQGKKLHDGAELAAIKVYRHDAVSAAVDRELTALTSVDSAHIVGVVDAAAEGSRQCVVLRLLDPGGLARLLASRATLSRGELVTLLVPLARAVNAMHVAGVSHGSLNASKVLFTESGAPVLLGGAHMTTAAHPPSRSALREGGEFLKDRRALWALASDLLARASQPGDVSEFADWVHTSAWDDPGFPDELSERAFDTGPPTPLSIPWLGLQPADDDGRGSLPPPNRHQASQLAGPRGTARKTRGFKSITERGHLTLTRLSEAYKSVRPRFRLLAIAGVVLIAGVLFTATAGGSARTGSGVERAEDAATTGALSDEGDLAPAVGRGDAGAVPDPTGTYEPEAVIQDTLMGDDPVAAATLLLSLRDECLGAASAECLEAVLQRDSAAWMADTAWLSQPRAGTEGHASLFHEGRDVTVVDIMGGVVLLSIDSAIPAPAPGSAEQVNAQRGPASVLIIRTEAGWRIRDVLPA